MDRATMRAPSKKSPQEQRSDLKEEKQEAEEITPFEEKMKAEVAEDVARGDKAAIPSAEEANACCEIQLGHEQSCEAKGVREKEGGGEAKALVSVEGEECSCAQEAQHAMESSEEACVPIILEEKKADIEKEKKDEGVQSSKQEERHEDNPQVVPERFDEEKSNEGEEEEATKPKGNGLGYWDAVREIMRAEANEDETISRKCEEDNQPESENMHGFINNHPSCKNCRGLARPA